MTIGPLRETRARAEQAARLRGCRYTWQAIADHLGYRSRQAAQIAAERHYARQRETPTAKRRSLSEGLDIVTTTLFEGLADAKRSGDVAAQVSYSREIRAVADQQAKLDGLHSPQKVDVTVTQTFSESITALREKLLDAIDAEVVEELPKGIER